MKNELDILNAVYTKITFVTLDDALDHINADDKTHADILETGDNRPVFFTGELIIYTINKHKYSGVVIDLYVENDSIVYLVIKRLGVAQLYDIITLKDGHNGGIDILFDKYSNGMHKSSNCNMSFNDIVNTLTYNVGNVDQSMYIAIQEALIQYEDMNDALDEITNPENHITMH